MDPQVSDHELRQQLARRAAHAGSEVAVARIVAHVQTDAAPQRRRRWSGVPRMAFGIATVAIALVVVAVLSFGGVFAPGPSDTPVAGGTLASSQPSRQPPVTAGQETPTPTGAPVPGTISVADLERLIASGAEQDVVVAADLDVKGLRDQHRRGPLCSPGSSCPVGLVAGTAADVWTIVGSDVANTIPAEADAIAGPMALHVKAHSLQLLGFVHTSTRDVLAFTADPSSLAQLEQEPPGLAVVVHGWLFWSGPLPCAAPVEPTPPPDTPFAECPWAWISREDPGTPAAAGPPPAGTIPVQYSAYLDFAGPEHGTETFSPRAVEGTYILNLVADPRPDCSPCRGWKVVGRIEPVPVAPETSPSPSSGPLLTVAQLQAVVAQAQKDGISRDVAVDAPIVQDPVLRSVLSCTNEGDPCLIGVVAGTTELVSVPKGSDVERMVSGGGLPTTAPIALRITGTTVQLLGLLKASSPTGLTYTPGKGQLSALENGVAGQAVVVHGWLGWGGAVECPPPASGTDPDSTFNRCPGGWITAASYASSGAWVNPPLDGFVYVQSAAYEEFAPNPSGIEPREGDYILNLVASSQPNCSPCRGWKVVGRIDETAGQIPVPSPEPSISAPLQVLSPGQLDLLLSTPVTSPITLVADVSVDTNAAFDWAGCQGADPCWEPWGLLHLTRDYTVDALATDVFKDWIRADPSAPVVLTIQPDGHVQFLGHVLAAATPSWWLARESVVRAWEIADIGRVLVVDGWLNRLGGDSCDVSCSSAWLQANDSGWRDADSVSVQAGAYEDFSAPTNGHSLASGGSPAHGLYLLRLLPNDRADGHVWEVVGRLDEFTADWPDVALADDSALQSGSQAPGTAINVRGWLVSDGPPRSCPTILPPTTPPPDIYGPSCYDGDWITLQEFQPYQEDGIGFTLKAPDEDQSVRVQHSAYQQYAPNPDYTVIGAEVPRLGTYRLVLVQDPRFPTDGALGWQLVERLDIAPPAH